MLVSAGWEVLRIKWIDMYKNPEEWILKAKEFIDGGWFSKEFVAIRIL